MDLKTLLMISLFALLAMPGIASATSVCKSYGESCAGTGTGCCSGLVCDNVGANPSYKCNQAAGVCDVTPESWVFKATPQELNAPGSVKGSIESAQSGSGLVGGGTGVYSVGWFNNWQTAGIIGVLIAVFIIAIAAIIGHSFNMPEVKAFVDTELMQAIVSVLLIVSMMGLIAFFDETARLAIATGGFGAACTNTGSEPCYVSVARQYLSTYYDVGSKYAQDELELSVRYQNFANQGRSIQANLWKLGFAGVNFRLNAGLSVEAERAGAIFESVTKMLASIYAQRYFIDVISYGIAPILLLLGILLRTFFFTRKLGGLLLAIALALFLVYPLTYALSWYTLKVNLYGDRLTADSPSCPTECRLSPPAAFYVKPDASGNGHIEYFQQESDLVAAGITRSNWDTGDVKGTGSPDYPGLVACNNLINLPQGGNPSALQPPNQCMDPATGAVCPSYCREVPNPSQYPDCQSTACSLCNPGCKIMRLRLDCTSPAVCPSGCTEECKAQLPVENKCYINQYAPVGTDPVVKADLSVSCGGCGACPNWCLLRKPDPNDPSKTVPVYNDAACSVPACKPEYLSTNGVPGTCPDKCAYITEVGGDTSCTTLCNGCPEPCRVKTGLDLNQYDTEKFMGGASNSYCSQFATACNSCPNICKVDIPADPRDTVPQPPQCAPYPTSPQRQLDCTSCPDYCRFNDYSFIPDVSKTPRDPATNTPAVCGSGNVKCSSGDCSLDCKAASTPLVCRPYDNSNPADASLCRQCPESCRVLGGGAGDQIPQGCDTIYCKSPAQGGFCPDACKVQQSSGDEPPVCSEYIGFGQGDPSLETCWGGSENCWSIGQNVGQCLTTIGCQYGLPSRCWGPSDCTAPGVKYNQGACNAAASQQKGCIWAQAGDINVPIDYRNWPANNQYTERSQCMQCPENCRVGDKSNDCGIMNNGNNGKVDCSVSSCPLDCRVPLQKAENGGPTYCEGFIPFDTPGFGCPALCRRLPGDSNPANVPGNFCGQAGCQDYNAATGVGTTDLCRVSNAPAKACGQCFDCPMDCVYKPAVRTDCSELCGDTGEGDSPDINTGSFLKKLPGASGRTDVRNAGILMIPALVLPLFNIVIVIAFIRVFSPTLGGDIEIPGLSRII